MTSISKLSSLVFVLPSLVWLAGCADAEPQPVPVAHGDVDLTQWVNPMIGTSRMGHTYPGATVPYGGVQLSPCLLYTSPSPRDS